MIAVIFELQPKAGESDNYFSLACELKPLVEGTDGFVSIERFQSLLHPDKYLSLSFWRDEKAVAAWRHNMQHRDAQNSGRKSIFQNYRLRVAMVMRDYGLHDRNEVPD